MKDIYNRVVKCILEVDQVEGVNFLKERNITPEFDLNYFDLVEVYNLYISLNEEFTDIHIPLEEFEDWKTVQDIVTTIERII